jgi:hypothetical protein
MSAQSILPIRKSLLDHLERTLTPQEPKDSGAMWSENLQKAAKKRGCRVFTDDEILEIRYRKEILNHRNIDLQKDYDATKGQIDNIINYMTRSKLIPTQDYEYDKSN